MFGGNGLLGQRLQPEIALRVVAQERYVEIVTRIMERVDGIWVRDCADREELGRVYKFGYDLQLGRILTAARDAFRSIWWARLGNRRRRALC